MNPKTLQHFKNAFAILLLLSALLTSFFWKSTFEAFSPQVSSVSYERLRIMMAFGGFPIDQLAQWIDARLPRSVPIALDESLLNNDFLKQRISEGLYPRPIEKTSPYRLQITDQPILNGLDPGRQNPTPDGPAEEFSFSFFYFLALLLGAMSFGGWLFVFLKRFRVSFLNLDLLPTTCLFVAALFLCFSLTLATWLQVALSWKWIAFFSILFFIGLFFFLMVRHKTRFLSFLKELLEKFRQPEVLAFAGLLFVYFIRTIRVPVYMWDGRSIWLFHTKRIFMNGMFSRADLVRPDTFWSHPDYPLLYPTWLSYFSSLSPLYNERMASLGIAVFWIAILVILWIILRSRLGRIHGAVLTFFIFLTTETFTFGGNVDAVLMGLLTIAFLGLTSTDPDHKKVARIALCCASLTKSEGLFLGLTLAFFAKERLKYFVVFLPAISHRIWIKFLGIETVFKEKTSAQVFTDLPERFNNMLPTLSPMLFENGNPYIRTFLCAAVFATPIMVFILLKNRKLVTASLKTALLSCFFFTAFAFAAVLAIPERIEWVVVHTLDRLLLHPAALVLISVFLIANDSTRERIFSGDNNR